MFGSLDGQNYYAVNYVTDSSDTAATAALTSTATGAKVIYLANATSRAYRYFKITTTLNTNITYHAELYAFGY